MTFLTEQECSSGLDALYSYIELEINEEDGDAVAEHIAKLSSLQAYSSMLLASTEFLKLKYKTPEFKSMSLLADRLNAAIGKSIMGYVTILSRLKEESRFSRTC